MNLPLQITFRGTDPSAAMEAKIRERAARIERFAARITSCHVTVEAPHRHHQHGNLWHIHIDITVPGGELTVSRQPAAQHSHEDVFVAIRDAFDAAVRQLEDYTNRQRIHHPGRSASGGTLHE